MRNYEIEYDIMIAKELLGMTMDEISKELGVSRMTVNNWINNPDKVPGIKLMDFYNMAFKNGVRINKIKEQFYREEVFGTNKLLFHGAKSFLEGSLSLDKSKDNNDFGKGFYCGESLEQSAMFVSNFLESSLYILDFDTKGLVSKTFSVDREWMLTIAYFRGRLGEFKDSPLIIDLLDELKGVDYIVAPIADNRIFELIDSFVDGDMTDIQCKHCLSATNLGNQYVLLTQKALDNLEILSHCYLAQEEKTYYLNSRHEFSELNRDKVKIARKKYRGEGLYIEEILK